MQDIEERPPAQQLDEAPANSVPDLNALINSSSAKQIVVPQHDNQQIILLQQTQQQQSNQQHIVSLIGAQTSSVTKQG